MSTYESLAGIGIEFCNVTDEEYSELCESLSINDDYIGEENKDRWIKHTDWDSKRRGIIYMTERKTHSSL